MEEATAVDPSPTSSCARPVLAILFSWRIRLSTSAASRFSNSSNLRAPRLVLRISSSILARHTSECIGLDVKLRRTALHPLQSGVYPIFSAAARTSVLIRWKGCKLLPISLLASEVVTGSPTIVSFAIPGSMRVLMR